MTLAKVNRSISTPGILRSSFRGTFLMYWHRPGFRNRRLYLHTRTIWYCINHAPFNELPQDALELTQNLENLPDIRPLVAAMTA